VKIEKQNMQTAQASPAFPPADALLEFLTGIDYTKHFRTFLATAQVVLVWSAAIVFVALQRFFQWWSNSGRDLTVKFAEDAYLWTTEVAVPRISSFFKEVENTFALVADNL
jgi:hypothetical protein